MAGKRSYDYGRVVDFIVAFKKANDGNSPTFREIQAGCGISSLSHTQYILQHLDDEGRICLVGKKHSNRMIKIPGGRWMPGKLAKEAA